MLGNLKAGISKYPNTLHQGSLECDSAITKNTNEQMWTIEVFYFVCFFTQHEIWVSIIFSKIRIKRIWFWEHCQDVPLLLSQVHDLFRYCLQTTLLKNQKLSMLRKMSSITETMQR